MGDRSPEEEEQSPRFLLDAMLGTLTRNLRMLGFDAEYAGGRDPGPMIRKAVREGRWFLTRRGLREKGSWGVPILKIKDDLPHRQVLQVLSALPSPSDPSRWFTRCLRCNRLLDELPREEALGLVPEHIAHAHRQFRRCASCGRVFWSGSHRQSMSEIMEKWVKEARGIEGNGLENEAGRGGNGGTP